MIFFSKLSLKRLFENSLENNKLGRFLFFHRVINAPIKNGTLKMQRTHPFSLQEKGAGDEFKQRSIIFARSLMLWAVFFAAAFSFSLKAQTKTNLDVFKTLVDSSIAEALVNLSHSQKDIRVDLKLGSAYSIFEDQIFRSIQSRDKNIRLASNSAENIGLSYSIENAVVNYGEVFRDGFLGDHFVERKIFISGSYRIQDDEIEIKNFSFENIDTVKFDEIQALENSSHTFTKGEIPSEPFFSNLFEPLVAISTAAVVIALFFTVRSK